MGYGISALIVATFVVHDATYWLENSSEFTFDVLCTVLAWFLVPAIAGRLLRYVLVGE